MWEGDGVGQLDTVLSNGLLSKHALSPVRTNFDVSPCSVFLSYM